MRFIKSAAAISLTALCLAGTAQAAPVTIGSPLVGPFAPTGPNGTEATLLNLAPEDPLARATSPVSGAIVRWHLLGAEGGPFTLRVLRPAGGTAYTAVRSSAPVTASSPGLATFSTALPIQAGDTIGLDIVKGINLGVRFTPLASVAIWMPPLTEGSTQGFTESQAGGEYGFNAEVQPVPAVTGVSPGSGSLKGGSAVTISGTDFAAVSGVSFGGVPATSFSVASEGQLTAVAPAGTPGTTGITVTTVAGASPASAVSAFTYTACVVPKLKDKHLKAAKKKLRKAGCKVGKVKRKTGVSAKAGEVVKQSRDPGGKLPPGAKINLTLG